MIMTELDQSDLFVGPHGPQNVVTLSFDFSPPATLSAMTVKVLRITATGTIGSGVWFTGQTPPSGWSMLADSPDWPLNTSTDPGAPRYGLIGTFDPLGSANPQWFFIGDSATILAGDPAIPHIPTMGLATLRLAVNEPNPDNLPPGRGLLGDGEGHWQVHVLVQNTIGSDMESALSCSDLSALLNMSRSRATRLCSAIGRARGDRDTDALLMGLAWTLFGVAIAGLAAVSGNILGAHIVVLGTAPDPTPAGLGERIAAAVAALAGATVSGAPVAVSGGLGTLIAFWGLVALSVITFALAIAATVVYMNALATYNNGVSQWSALLTSIQHLTDAGGRLGCSLDTSLPTCSSL